MSKPHPGREKLAAFGLGKLDDAQAGAVAAHLAACTACQAVVDSVPDDALVASIRPLLKPGGQSSAMSIDSWVPPELVGHPRYRLREWLGAGGMGIVYKAEHRVMKRPVALKVINKKRTTSEAAVERFRREVQAAAKLNHPNIVRAFDADQAGDLHFLAMEFIEGTSLARVVEQRRPLPVHEAVDYARQTALGLQHAFECGMVHRDIKPQNLLLTPQSQVKILDFGLAGFTESTEGAGAITQVGQVLGTPDFIAPEQSRDSHTADIRADIYSLGCCLYFMLAGHPPFTGSSALEKIMAHLERQPAPLQDIRKDVPDVLVQILAKMMAKEPSQRFQTPAEVTEALASVKLRSSVPKPRNRRAMAALVAVLLGVSVVLLGEPIMKKLLFPVLMACGLWTAEPTPTQAEADSKADPKTETVKDSRTPVPDAAAQEKVDKLIKDLFKDDYAKKAPADKLALSAKLLEQAGETKDDAAARFVLLREARDLAAQAGNLEEALKTVDELTKQYAVNGLEMKIGVLEVMAGVSTNPANSKLLVDTSFLVLEELLAADNFEAAGRLLKVAQAAGRNAKSVPLLSSIQACSADMEFLKKEYEKAKAALDTLKKNPKDAEASLVAGKYLCLLKGDWDKGLPLLAGGSDAKLKKLAERDAGKPASATDQAALADEWWELAEKEKERTKKNLRVRAAHWYSQAVAGLSGLSKTKAETRIREVETQVGSKSVDLLKLIQLDKDIVKGKWAFQGKALVSTSGGLAGADIVRVPYAPPEEYNLSFVVEGKTGSECLGIGIKAPGRQGHIIAIIDSRNDVGYRSGLQFLDGKVLRDQAGAYKGQLLTNGKSVRLDLSVRKTGLTLAADGRQIISFSGDYTKRFPQDDTNWTIPEKDLLFLVSHTSPFHVSKAELTPVSGKGRLVER
jgi:tRNA A-37 threonylcarbamoyl transferase component Bud32